MREDTQEYYRELGREYPVRIRQLVPAYDEMVDTICHLLAHEVAVRSSETDGGDGEAGRPPAPDRVLDLGLGEGTLASRVLASLPTVHLTGIDASPEMLDRARERLAEHDDRIELLEADLTGLHPPGPLVAAYSSLTLHNLERPEKSALLERLRKRLAPGGPFIWADLIRHDDPVLQEHLTRQRVARARAEGCPEDFIAWNFEKEGSEDVPLTPHETRELALDAGFRRATAAWVQNLFAVFVLRA